MTATAAISVASYRRLGRARIWLESRNQSEEVLVVGATLDGANETARTVAKGKGGAFGWHRLSFSQLAAAIAAPVLATRGLAPLSRVGTEAIVAGLVHRLKAESGLRRYQAVANTPGFPRAITGVIGELRSALLPLDAVETVAPDLAAMIRAYERELADGSFSDWPGLLQLATEAINAPHRPRLIGLPTLLVDVPISTEAEFAFLTALAVASPEMLATIPAADATTLRRMRDRLGFNVEDLDQPPVAIDSPGPGDGALARLQRHLFNEREKPPEAEASNEIEVFSAPGEGRECVEIARRVLALVREGVPFDRIAVLLRSPEGYRAHLKEGFARADIPVHFARSAVRPHPAGRAFCALLECAAEGLSARKFAEYLSLGQVPDATPGGTPPAPRARGDLWSAPDPELVPPLAPGNANDPPASSAENTATPASRDAPVQDGQLRAPRRWERLLVEAAVIGGRDRWRRRIDGLSNELRRKIAELGREDETQAAAFSRTLDDLAAFAAYALPLIDELDSLPAAAHWGDWLDRLGALATRTLKQPDRVLAILAELAPMAPVGPAESNEVLNVLRTLLLETAVPPFAQRYGKVFVGPIDTARGLTFDAVFVPGLAEKMFPRKIVEEPILLDGVRMQVGRDLATNQTRLERERLALALAAGAAERRIFFSYPRIDLDQARPRVPSFYALEAVRSAEGRLPDFAELARRAETAATSRLGWPAPPDPDTAIDDAEHDLAILDGLMALSDEGAGRARYLLTANPYLARALRTRYQRWSRNWTSADGLLNPSAAVRAIMGKHALSARSYSPTALQNYARCPYRFFLQAVHGLGPREVPAEIDELDPLQRGSLIHDVQFELFARLRLENLLPVQPSNLNRAQQILEEVTTEVAARYEDDLAPAIDRVWENGVAAIRADLREWLRRASEDDSGFVPRHFELSFGLAHRFERRQADPRSVADAVGLDCGIRLRGSIDLVERHPSRLLRVTDHKTGKFDGASHQVIDGGKTLQPVLYALAVEKLFAGEGKVTEGRLYFCTSTGGFSEQVVALDNRARDAAVKVAEAIGDAIDRPFLPAAPGERECERCDYRVVCGPYEEYRSARKPQENLDPLFTVRGWP
jgi:ATP-dependent helicase/nuclease subunit B